MRLKKGSKSVDGFVRGGADDATMAIGLGALLWLIDFARLLSVSGNLAIRPNEFKLRQYLALTYVAIRLRLLAMLGAYAPRYLAGLCHFMILYPPTGHRGA